MAEKVYRSHTGISIRQQEGIFWVAIMGFQTETAEMRPEIPTRLVLGPEDA